jgi:hypothetical protein
MEEYQIPALKFHDTLGWGSTFLWVCNNDDCPVFVNGWKNMAEKHGQLASFRYMIQPDSGEAGVLPAFNADVLDLLMEERRRFLDIPDNRNPF